jgi:hypothetical protein
MSVPKRIIGFPAERRALAVYPGRVFLILINAVRIKPLGNALVSPVGPVESVLSK